MVTATIVRLIVLLFAALATRALAFVWSRARDGSSPVLFGIYRLSPSQHPDVRSLHADSGLGRPAGRCCAHGAISRTLLHAQPARSRGLLLLCSGHCYQPADRCKDEPAHCALVDRESAGRLGAHSRTLDPIPHP